MGLVKRDEILEARSRLLIKSPVVEEHDESEVPTLGEMQSSTTKIRLWEMIHKL